jgi:hypothetical protein
MAQGDQGRKQTDLVPAHPDLTEGVIQDLCFGNVGGVERAIMGIDAFDVPESGDP